MSYKSAILVQLEIMRNKGGCFSDSTQHKADKAKAELYRLLPEKEFNKLSIAHAHFVTGEGPEELYDVCKELYNKYSHSN